MKSRISMLFTIESLFRTLSTCFEPLYTNMHVIDPSEGAALYYAMRSGSKFMEQPLYIRGKWKTVFLRGEGGGNRIHLHYSDSSKKCFLLKNINLYHLSHTFAPGNTIPGHFKETDELKGKIL